MSHLYRSVYPLTQQDTYVQNQVNRFILGTAGQAILPGSIRITGKCAISSAAAPVTAIPAGSSVYIDPAVGYHALFMKLESGTRAQGTVESLTYYPRLVKTKATAKAYNMAQAVDGFNSIEGKGPNVTFVNGMLQGLGNAGGAVDPYIPFSIMPDIWANKTDGPIAGSKIGNELVIQFTLATNQQVLFGSDVTANHNYVITDLKCDWQAVNESAVDLTKPVNFEKYLDDRQLMIGPVTSVNTVAPGGLVDAVHMSFVKQADEFALAKNYLQTAPPPGEPLYYPAGGNHSDLGDYGLERIVWSLGNSDTTLCGFIQDEREEILWNALRSLNIEPYAWSFKLDDSYMKDGYIAGIPFGGLQDLLQKRFAMQLYSKCTSAESWACYLFFRSQGVIA